MRDLSNFSERVKAAAIRHESEIPEDIKAAVLRFYHHEKRCLRQACLCLSVGDREGFYKWVDEATREPFPKEFFDYRCGCTLDRTWGLHSH